MVDASTGRFALPDEPVDGYVIDAWQADIEYTAGAVRHLRFVYHVNRTWMELFPDEVDELPPGAPFEDEWQVFDGDNFLGRRGGWKGPLEWLNAHAFVFATEREAQVCASDRLRERIDRHFEEVAAAATKLRLLEEKLGAGSPPTESKARSLYRQLKADGFHVILTDAEGRVVGD